MADEAAEKESAPAKAAKPKLGGLFENKVVLLGAIVIVQALTALAVTQFFIAPKLKATHALAQAQLGGHETAAPVEQEREGVIAGLGEMIVTLAGEGGDTHYLRINVNLEVADAKVAKVVEERAPQLRDIAILALSSRTVAELLTPEGKEGGKKDIHERLSAKLPAEALLGVYFSDLMIQ